ncbi:glycosyltransferase (plasmid) [Neorhizobium sp. SOG26]|uniref:WecB/TagA/CpsF family glycosyltransferase n=1 Tax=Neorhizobium sp. SOG26 TaxID=2060726 RepID=UPI000E57D681|nr:WecB/TagA/CpsF family glycosyltransferase [Neorhizobium sp. SOG26]AXV17677.1 glycosyltransferase [Neorhizobium sp. SOG26]
MAIIETSAVRSDHVGGPSQRKYFLGSPFDPVPAERVLGLLANPAAAAMGFRYIVTPNVDHVVRMGRNIDIKRFYRQAWFSVCDSRPIAMLARLVFLKLPVVTGSDLTVSLFKSVIRDGDLITLIASQEAVVHDLRERYPNVRFRAYLPPQGIWDNPEAMQACIDFVARAEARFVFIAVGSPQSEKIAYELSRHPDARGIGLCIGASLEFLVGVKKRAPLWMQRAGLEWVHRMASDPRRLWRRYAYAVLPLASLFLEELASRPKPKSP